MRAIVLTIVGVLAACSPETPSNTAGGASPASTSEPQVASDAAEFMAPSGNLGCIYTPAGGTDVYKTPDGAAELKCDRVEPDYVRVTLPEHGAASVLTRVGDASCCSGETLAYGAKWAAGPFQCEMAESGLTCSSAEGHGFTLSRESADTR